MRHKRAILGAGLVSALALSACGGADDGNDTDDAANGGEEVQTSPELHIAYNAQPPSMDPLTTTAHVTGVISRNVFEPLLALDENGEPQPVLAESYEVSDDGLTISFQVREGVPFHDGSTVETEDVVASLERWIEMSDVGQNYFPEATVDSPEDGVVDLNLPEPMYVAPYFLASVGQAAHIMPADVLQGAGPEGLQEFVGTGPYEFGEWATDQHIRLDRFEEYVSPEGEPSGMAGAKEAHFEEMYFNFVTDSSTRVSGLQTGEWDIAMQLPFDNADVIENDPNTDIVIGDGGLIYAVPNKREGVMSDVNMRQALLAAIDPEEILQAAYSDPEYWIDNGSLMPEESIWYVDLDDDQQELYSAGGQDQVDDYLEAAGYDGEEIRIVTTRDYEDAYNTTVVLQQHLEAAGMNVDLIVADWPTVLEIREDETAYEIAITSTSTWPAVPATFVFLQPSWPGWTENDEIESAIDQILAAEDQDGAVGAMEDLQDAMYDYLPVVKYGERANLTGLGDNVDGYEYITGLGEIYHRVELSEE